MSDGANTTKEQSKLSKLSDLISSIQEKTSINSSLSSKIRSSLLGTADDSDEKSPEAESPIGILENIIQALRGIGRIVIKSNRNLEEIQKELDIS